MKLIRTIFRRFGYALIPIDAVDYIEVRVAVWKARALDPVQAESDKRAFAALLAAVEEHF